MKKKNYLNIEICKKCGGVCCKKLPGATYPEDFEEPLLESLVETFKSGDWAIDWWEGNPTHTGRREIDKAYYVRPRTKNSTKLFNPSWGGGCIFLDKKGCKLLPEERPKSCRMLEPKLGGVDCIHHDSTGKRGAAIAWLPFTTVVLEAAKIVMEKKLVKNFLKKGN